MIESPPPRLDPADHPWLGGDVQLIVNTLAAGGGEARFVGGAVRDAMVGRAVGDIDLATNLPPDRVIALLTAAGIKTVPTGLAHGTITAVIARKGYEITTLRHDIDTDGRRAIVAFTDDWQADAARRDFTFNALYADTNGRVYDYTHGLADLSARKVRFIGDARARIREDVLRILRFFRFTAWYGQGTPDTEALNACRERAPLLPRLSAERVWRELSKLLLAPDPAPTWQLMVDNDILPHILPEAVNVTRLKRLVSVEKQHAAPSALRRLAALVEGAMENNIPRRLHLSNHDAAILEKLTFLPSHLHGKTDPVPLRKLLYKYGGPMVREALLLYTADHDGKFSPQAALNVIEAWISPRFPLRGEDFVREGLSVGPQIGTLLRAVENWWQDQDFHPAREACLAEARRIIQARG